MCENESDMQFVSDDRYDVFFDEDLVSGQITVYEGKSTLVVNVLASLDVYVRDDESDSPIFRC